MVIREEAGRRLESIPGLSVAKNFPLSHLTRFGIGGAAWILSDAGSEQTLASAIGVARTSGLPWVVLGGGTNLIVADSGFPGIVLRYRAARLECRSATIMAESGADLQALVDFSISRGLAGLETMTGIPGWVGAGIYGNAGAYGRSISDSLSRVRYLQGDTITEIGNHGCRFTYRESVFKSHKDWIILSAEFTLREGDPALLLRTAADILTVRNRKYPPEMRCAGSIFKNLMLAELPEEAARTVPEALVREGKVPSAFFLEQVGAKGMRRGGIRVADYHANLIYNEGGGAASDLRGLIRELKTRVRDKFGLELEEEVQYVGFCDGA